MAPSAWAFIRGVCGALSNLDVGRCEDGVEGQGVLAVAVARQVAAAGGALAGSINRLRASGVVLPARG
jgi:hypothetical protein